MRVRPRHELASPSLAHVRRSAGIDSLSASVGIDPLVLVASDAGGAKGATPARDVPFRPPVPPGPGSGRTSKLRWNHTLLPSVAACCYNAAEFAAPGRLPGLWLLLYPGSSGRGLYPEAPQRRSLEPPYRTAGRLDLRPSTVPGGARRRGRVRQQRTRSSSRATHTSQEPCRRCGRHALQHMAAWLKPSYALYACTDGDDSSIKDRRRVGEPSAPVG